LVNIGSTRPAITAMMNSTTSSASVMPTQPGSSSTPSSCRCTASEATAISASSPTKK
jgi:hypothetical protein